MSDLLSDIDVAGAMLLIQQRGGDKPTPAETGVSGSERKNDGAFSPTQPSAPGQAKKKKTAVAPKDNNKGGAMISSNFVYDNYDWQTYEVFDVSKANAPLKPAHVSAKVARPVELGPDSSAGAKRKIAVQKGAREATQAKKKRKKSKTKIKAQAGVPRAADPRRGAGAPRVMSSDLLNLEIGRLKRLLAEKTAALEQAVSLRSEVARSVIPRHMWAAGVSSAQMQADSAARKTGSGHGAAATKIVSSKASRWDKNALRAYAFDFEQPNAEASRVTGIRAEAALQLSNGRKRATHKAQSVNGAGFISLTRITNGGKFKFAEAKAFEVDEPDDDVTIPPFRLKMAEWETRVNRGQWGRLRLFTDCKRCFGHCGASHKKDDGCLAAQEVRRYKLKKHYMDIQRRKIKELKRANNMCTKEERRKLARSNMSVKQRALFKKKAKAILPCCV